MGNRKDHITQEVERTLAVFDRAERLSAGPWFAARVRARYRAVTEPTSAGLGRLRTRRLRPALLALIVLLNLVTAGVALERSNRSLATRTTYVNALATEIGLAADDTLLTLDE